jgi:hypothetical protein
LNVGGYDEDTPGVIYVERLCLLVSLISSFLYPGPNFYYSSQTVSSLVGTSHFLIANW